MPPKRTPPDRQKEFEPHERGDLRDMRDEWKLKKAVKAFFRSAFVWGAGTIAAIVVARDQILDVIRAIAGLISGGPK